MTVAILSILALGLYFVGRRRRVAPDLPDRVELLERRVAELQAVVDGLRPQPRPAPRPAPPPPPRERPAPPRAEPATVPTAPRATATPRPRRRRISSADLLGAKALAFAGGVVTLLGVVFFFVLAVNRGWIGPELRVGAGALASALVFGAGVWLQRRYGVTYSTLAAVGAGIAGAYATLLAAVALYDFLPKPPALVVAAAIASLAVALSLLWSAEVVAGFGLIGAIAVPAMLAFQGGLQQIGTAFVAVVFGGAAIVAVRQRWWKLLQAAALVSAPQALAQVALADAPGAGIVALAVACWLLYLGAGLAFQLRWGRALAAAPSTFSTGGAVFAGACAELLYNGGDRGIALLCVAGVYLAVSAAGFARVRELALLAGMLAVAVAAVGFGQWLSGSALTYAWAAEAAVIAWVGSRVRDTRLQLPALAYLSAAVVHALAVEARPDHFFEAVRHPAEGAPALAAVSFAALVFGIVRRSWDDTPSQGILRVLEPLLARLRAHEGVVDRAAYTVSAAVAAYAASLGILALGSFGWGHVAVTATWCAACVVAVALSRRAGGAVSIAFAALAVTIVKVLAFDVWSLTETQYGCCLAVAGAAALVAALTRDLGAKTLTAGGAVAFTVSLGLSVCGALVLWPSGYALLAVGGAYAAAGAAVFVVVRDVSTMLWALGLATAAVGAVVVLEGTWLVLALAATASSLAALSVLVRERRLQVASFAYVVLGAAYALATQAPPTDLVLARLHPAAGVPSVLLVIAAVATLAWSLAWHERGRAYAVWAAGALGVYAASLTILAAAQSLSPAGVHTDFQRGQTAVSTFWGALALLSLYIGLRRRRSVLRGGGFLLFGISLAKLFVFDLPNLSSAQRALSFLAVGAVLLLGGFFYQRLSSHQNGGPRIA